MWNKELSCIVPGWYTRPCDTLWSKLDTRIRKTSGTTRARVDKRNITRRGLSSRLISVARVIALHVYVCRPSTVTSGCYHVKSKEILVGRCETNCFILFRSTPDDEVTHWSTLDAWVKRRAGGRERTVGRGARAQMEGGQLFSICENKYALEKELTATTTYFSFFSVARRVVSLEVHNLVSRVLSPIDLNIDHFHSFLLLYITECSVRRLTFRRGRKLETTPVYRCKPCSKWKCSCSRLSKWRISLPRVS